MITTKDKKQNTAVMFILAVLLALGIGYRFNTTMDDHDSAGHPVETFNYR